MSTLLTETQAAAELQLPETYLSAWRTETNRPGPRWGVDFPDTPGEVRYPADDLERFRFSGQHAEALARRVAELEAA